MICADCRTQEEILKEIEKEEPKIEPTKPVSPKSWLDLYPKQSWPEN
jgi:hypothetical protein